MKQKVGFIYCDTICNRLFNHCHLLSSRHITLVQFRPIDRPHVVHLTGQSRPTLRRKHLFPQPVLHHMAPYTGSTGSGAAGLSM